MVEQSSGSRLIRSAQRGSRSDRCGIESIAQLLFNLGGVSLDRALVSSSMRPGCINFVHDLQLLPLDLFFLCLQIVGAHLDISGLPWSNCH